MGTAKGTAVAAMVLLAAGATRSDAAAIVIGSGLAHSCYIHALSHENAREGIDLCTRALETEALLRKDRASTFVNRGVLRASRGDYDGALDDYDRAIEVYPTLAQAFVDRSASLIALKRYSEAVSDATTALTLGPMQPELAYYNRAVAEEALGDVQGAYHDFKQAQAIAPGFIEAGEQLKRFHVVKKPEP